MDRVVAVCFIVLLIPVLIVIWIGISLAGNGSAIFAQTRVGRRLTEFRIYKFRTMRINCDTELACVGDKRVTKLGRILRRHRLDELPQLWNIAKGDMRWFGPRPEQPFYVERILQVDSGFLPVYSVKPGLLSLGVVMMGYARNIDEMMCRGRYDLIYVRKQCAGLNFYILYRAVVIAVKGSPV